MHGPRTLSMAILFCLLLSVAVPAVADTAIDERFDLRPGGRLVVDTARGKVIVTGHSGAGARVRITSGRDDFDERFELVLGLDGDTLNVEMRDRGRRWFGSWFRSWNDHLQFEIEVPERTELDVETSGGSIAVSKTQGAALLDTSGGAIRVEDVVGEVKADTSGGAIVIAQVDGHVNADTSGGGIKIEMVRGDVTADTSGGSIRIDDVTGSVLADTSGGSISVLRVGGTVNASTSGGSIAASFLPGNDLGGTLETSGGGIRVHLDPAVSLAIDAETSGGRVASQLELTETVVAKKNALKGSLGSGGSRLRIRTSGGSIDIGPL